ncbi:bifunctional [glutamine synthetase] adenylyltransferase/[glutamine synthetase]-adenylyl-L-tyrosine phosphorylase [Bifidobacterium choloepi]|uniref:Bifunctional [glutamine synthetase] adenylyltransferase/[glutamine synthetase]-adenylyl-L-tyrosine phosphorylase n=1 Tax=Bifidobacterium choloepi TaxID=2614131 RepID=A0A6I5MYA9_9BIFI|nr:bifunctional [glutamine synthetase] adenylyltransferase/[glutamine synthetase]-adenylyl-L-tyrosine phosphorylase [Bifidobacterium choloepi]NEG69176.1 bifunctional [glutamine synthetase] adenylyltransferase/[glutamine synthetase]-adenylyl-L-tyrosine phosphorylase [Bifidobacterium choloepi]
MNDFGERGAGRPVSTMDLIRAGLQELDAAKALLGELRDDAGYGGAAIGTLLDALAKADDPDVALRNYVDIGRDLANQGVRFDDLVPDDRAVGRIVRVLGASDALGKLMRFRPELVRAAATDDDDSALFNRRQRIEAVLHAIESSPRPVSDGEQPVAGLPLAEAATALRREYRRQLAAIMAQDVCADDPVDLQPRVSLELSDLADAALEGALAIARREVAGADRVRFAIIGMGKLGARELNYVSDVDLIYVVEPAAGDDPLDNTALTRTGTKMATMLQRACQSVIMGVAEPVLWQIDGGLRPEGKDGALVRRLASHEAYYEQWAENWEFQALLKARAVAGDEALGADYVAMTQPFVWTASKRENFVNDCQKMRERVEDLIPAPMKDREIKLGRGGLRDVEFTVQILQLVHGRSDESLRVASTMDALKALSEGGYISRVHARQLAEDYRFERVLEHRQQMWALKRTHLFPDLGKANAGGLEKPRDVNADELSRNVEMHRLARAFGLLPDGLLARYDETRREVRRLHNDIYYRPMLPISAAPGVADAIPGPDGTVGNGTDSAMAPSGDHVATLSRQAILDRYESIGFADPESAIRHVAALTEGVTRAAKINRILLPAVLRWLGEGQNPDMGLLYWRKLEEHFGGKHEYLGFLRDSPSAAQRLCHVLSNSRFLGDALDKSLESITWLGNDDLLRPRGRDSLDTQCGAIVARYQESERECATALRALRRHEAERIGLGWMNGVVDEADSLTGMTDVYDAIIDAALRWSVDFQLADDGLDEAPATLAVIAMGRYGGREVNFSSDADIILIYRPTGDVSAGGDDPHGEAANRFARKVVDRLRALLMGPVSLEPKIDLDLDLRPEGKNGPLVRSYASCEEYYRSWSSTWESQALLRARFAAGDKSLGNDFLTRIANPMRYPVGELTDGELAEIRKLKARMEAERLPRGVRRERHLKLGKGGLSDVEWTVQLLQLEHAGHIAALRTTSTMAALDELERRKIIDAGDAVALRRAWHMCTAARNGNYLWTGRVQQADILPHDIYSLGGIAVYLGYDANHGQRFENDIMAVMRKSRDVCERLFYGDKTA